MTAAIAAPARRLTREDIVRLGQAGRAWEFVPIGLQAVRIAPEDWGMRVLLAANFARLGLKIAAGEQLAALPDEVRSDDSVRGLTGVVEGLREDRLAPERLEAQVYLNLEALRGLDLAAELPRWKGQAREWEWFLAADENIVRRRGEQWVGLGDQRAAAAAFGREHLAKTTVHLFAVEGIDPPWLLQEVARRSERGKDGFWPRLYVVQADPVEFMNGLAHADLRSVLSQERTVALVGPDASERLLNDLRARLTGRINGAYIPLSRLGTPASPRVSEMLDTAEAEQVAEHERLVREVTALYAGRDIAWWRERFASGRPLRILVPSCRYTTFVQHAAADLVEALKRQGHEADLLFEADDSFRFSTLAYLRAISRLKPDLMVLINYMRQHIGEWVPRELPFVTWIQDAMPHLFDPALGRTLGDTDFVVGYLHPALIARCCYPKERTWATHIGASESKFHPGPVDPDRHRRSECEIALVSHHSETPEAMHQRLLRESQAKGAQRDALEHLYNELIPLSRDTVSRSLVSAVGSAAGQVLGLGPDDPALAYLTRHYALPLADRMVRHQTIEWADSAARRRGWRLRLYGRGWESHPRFGHLARGELQHGEELRASYQCATVHLHASAHAMLHQRVIECALSGGLPLCRLLADAVKGHRCVAERAASLREEPAVGHPGRRLHGCFVADHPEWMAHTCLLQRLGLPHEAFGWMLDEHRAAYRSSSPPPPAEPWLFGDLSQTAFTSEDHLERLVALALEQPSWRAAVSASMARAARTRFTSSRLACGIVEFVRRGLTGPDVGGAAP